MPNTLQKASQALQIIYRSLCADDAQAYQELRAQALTQEDRRYLVSYYASELQQSFQAWRDVCTQRAANGRGVYVAIGAFTADKTGLRLVGSSIAERWYRDEEQQTAYYKAIYVHPNYRRARIGENIILHLDAWARANRYNKAVFTIHAEKTEWIDFQRKRFGAVVIGSDTLPYADGKVAQTYYLERALNGGNNLPALPYKIA